ncbi:MAG: hypothetical protein ACO4AG_08680, partial [Candidatus Nanopelagicales bacterium]
AGPAARPPREVDAVESGHHRPRPRRPDEQSRPRDVTARGAGGARDYLRAHADEVVLIEVGDVATGEDLDVPTTP